ncbi:MAG: hypothetical protein JST89_05925 [Cyanobacteria bacterium SZAS-4]|nr:hypothetical protein [Cyanobacteria bacterium SZAS-4]
MIESLFSKNAVNNLRNSFKASAAGNRWFWNSVFGFFGLTTRAAENHLEKCSDSESPSLSILFIGNSFTYYDNMPLHFSKLAKLRFPNKEFKVYFQAGPGMFLGQHTEDERTMNTLMKSGKWDYVVLQDQSGAALRPLPTMTMKSNLKWFDKRIKQIHGKTALFMTWSDLDQPQDQVPISKGYREAAQELKAILIPAGELFLEVSQKSPEITLYDEDRHHPGHYGAFLVACLAEAILLHTHDELLDIANKRKNGHIPPLQDPFEQKLLEYADECAIREKSGTQ